MRLDRIIPTWIAYDRATGAAVRVDERVFNPVLHAMEPPETTPLSRAAESAPTAPAPARARTRARA